MTRRELLQEQYEDALFTLLMDELAVSEGKRALKEIEQLNSDDTATVSHKVNQRCLKTISNHFAKENFKKIRRSSIKILNKVAIIAFLSVLLFTSALATSEKIRAHTLNLLVEVLDDRTNFQLISAPPVISSLEDAQIVTNWIPKGYTLTSSVNESKSSWLTFDSLGESQLEVCVYLGDTSIIGFDTEDAYVENCNIQGFDAIYIEKQDVTQLVWANTDQNLVWEVYGINVPQEVLTQVAENITLKQK